MGEQISKEQWKGLWWEMDWKTLELTRSPPPTFDRCRSKIVTMKLEEKDYDGEESNAPLL